ncbi:hypothetical protein KKG41_01205 [Patescibacteria group bacterium]|nr:hypothetical protein [Patescibacteria group bacterium]MBU1890438.1 hypothetical protein [Patescibacteria group bacterium]
MPIDYPPPDEGGPDKEIRNALWKGIIQKTIGAAIILLVFGMVWWYFSLDETSNENTNQATTNTNTTEVVTGPTVTEIKNKFGDEFNFSLQNNVEGRNSWLGLNGTDYIQIFSDEEEIEQVSYVFSIGADGKLTDLQLDLARQIAEASVNHGYADWVMEQFDEYVPDKDYTTFKVEENFNDYSYYGRIRCDEISNTRFCSTTIRWPAPVLRAQPTDDSVFNFEYIGESEENEELEPVESPEGTFF